MNDHPDFPAPEKRKVKKPLKTGDRVRVYYPRGIEVGTVVYADKNKIEYEFIGKQKETGFAHPKQCRRLIKHQKQKTLKKEFTQALAMKMALKILEEKVQPRFVGFSQETLLVKDNRLIIGEITPTGSLKSTSCAVFVIDEKDLTPEIRTKYNIKE